MHPDNNIPESGRKTNPRKRSQRSQVMVTVSDSARAHLGTLGVMLCTQSTAPTMRAAVALARRAGARLFVRLDGAYYCYEDRDHHRRDPDGSGALVIIERAEVRR